MGKTQEIAGETIRVSPLTTRRNKLTAYHELLLKIVSMCVFTEAAKNFDSKIYYVQQEHGPHWQMLFSKLRRNNAACMEKYHLRDPQMHQGIYNRYFSVRQLIPEFNLEKNIICRIQSHLCKSALCAGL